MRGISWGGLNTLQIAAMRPPELKAIMPMGCNSLLFDSAPFEHDLEILGYPIAKIRVSADVPVAQIAVRLTEVTPEPRWPLRNPPPVAGQNPPGAGQDGL